MEELKSCPFCGSDAKLVKDDQGGIYAECTSEHCGCSLDYASRDNETTRAYIIEQWNTRAERTCHIIVKPSDSDYLNDWHYLCSECGCPIGVDEIDKDEDENPIPIRHASFCGNCGAKVV